MLWLTVFQGDLTVSISWFHKNSSSRATNHHWFRWWPCSKLMSSHCLNQWWQWWLVCIDASLRANVLPVRVYLSLILHEIWFKCRYSPSCVLHPYTSEHRWISCGFPDECGTYFLTLVDQWCHMATYIKVRSGLDDGLWLPEPMLTYHPRYSVVFTSEKFHNKRSWIQAVTWVWILHFEHYWHIFQGPLS